MSVATTERKGPVPAGVAHEALTHDDLVARAAALVPELRGRVPEAEQLRKVPPANVEALRKAGLFRVLQARRYGGHQQSLRTHIDTIATIALGCGSTAWCMGVIHAHSWLMAHFPQAAQEETFGANPDAIISAVISPRGKAKPAKGGYVLNGVWPFGSGCACLPRADNLPWWVGVSNAVSLVLDAGGVCDDARSPRAQGIP